MKKCFKKFMDKIDVVRVISAKKWIISENYVLVNEGILSECLCFMKNSRFVLEIFIFLYFKPILCPSTSITVTP